MKALARVACAAAAFLILVTAAGAVPGRAYVLWTGSKVYVSRAWVLQNEPTGPNSRVFRTTDGGRSWRIVSKLATYGGKVAFVSPRDGWLAGQRLLRTVDGGRSWQIQPLPAPHGYSGRLVLLTAPRFFGRDGELAGQYGGDKPVIGFYRTRDGGRHWHLLSTLPGSSPGAFPQFVLSAVSASTAWLLTAGAKPAVYVTRDGGRRWSATSWPAGSSRRLR